MDYTFIIIGFVGGAILIFIIEQLVFQKEKDSSVKQNLNADDIKVFKNIETHNNISIVDPSLINEVRKLLAEGKKIQAIKLVVTNRKMGLKEAKDFVETLNTSYKS